MKVFAALLQIGELFRGHFSWLGLAQLILFAAMGLIAVSFSVFAGYKAFQSKSKK